jgi:NADPH2:quinone reductase
MKAVTFTGAGGNEVVEVHERDDLHPKDDEVLVEAVFAGMNPADIAQREGNYPAPEGVPADIPGLEVAGVITATGENVVQFQAGDRVMGLVSGGGYATQVIVPERQLVPCPDGLSEEIAAAIPEAYITAHDAIRGQADLQSGDVLLVSGGSGGVGGAAVQIGVQLGATVVATSRHVAGREAIESWGGVACDPSDVKDTLERVSPSGRADVLLELVGGSVFENNLRTIGHRARVIVVGVGLSSEVKLNLFPLMAKRVSIQGTTLRARSSEEKAVAVRLFEKELMPLIRDGKLKPNIDAIFDLSDVHRAFTHMESSGRIGKTILRMGQNS